VSDAPSTDQLALIAEQLLAQAAFVFAELSQEELSDADTMHVARVSIKGEEAWQLTLAVQTNLGRELAGNLLGIEETSDEAGDASADAVGEMANILAGALAAEFHGPEGPCRIGIPTLTLDSGAKIQAALAAAERKASFTTENGSRLAVFLTPEGTS
jgi:chemotaxis protein CheY-P-specific phosphatase CheC